MRAWKKIAALGLCCLLTGASQMLMPVETQAAGQWSGYIQDYSTK